MSQQTPLSGPSKRWSCETLEAGIEAAAQMAGLDLKTPENQKFFQAGTCTAAYAWWTCLPCGLRLCGQETRKFMLNMSNSAAA